MISNIGDQRLLRMEVSNFKRVSFLELRFGEDENLCIISGNNGEGKSSALDAIESALGGGHSIPAEPLKKGKAKGYTILETTDYVIKRTYTAKSTAITVEAKDGSRINKPQQLLDSLIGSISFDPLAFANMKSKEQVESLQSLLGIDFTQLDKEHNIAYEERRDLNRELKSTEARYDSVEGFESVPSECTSPNELMQKIQDAQDINQLATGAANGLAAARRNFEEASARAESAEQAFRDATTAALETINKVEIEEKHLKETTARIIDIEPLRQQLSELDATNEKIRNNIQRHHLREELDSIQKRVDAAQQKISDSEEKKRETLSKAKMPVSGLTFDETGIRFNDIPFEQCSQAEKLRISTAMGVSQNPKLKLMLIRDGSLLDNENMKLMIKLAIEFKTLILLEYAGKHENAKVVMEDGHALVNDAEYEVSK